jgi:hypothetical protein
MRVEVTTHKSQLPKEKKQFKQLTGARASPADEAGEDADAMAAALALPHHRLHLPPPTRRHYGRDAGRRGADCGHLPRYVPR